MKPVCVVVFDAVGTLILPQTSVAEIYFRLGQKHGSQLAPLVIHERLGRLFSEIFSRSPGPERMGDAGQRKLWRELVFRLFTDVPDPEPLFQALWQRFASPETWSVFSDVAPALEVLSQRGYRLVIGSSFDSRLHAIVAGLPELHRVELVFTTAETGCTKPDPSFYESITRSLNVTSADCLMVGDSLRDDVTGPIAAGWQAVYLDRDSSGSSGQDYATITTLDQLPVLLHAPDKTW